MWITLLGDPGTGKTTLGQRLQTEGVAAYISGSALLDEYILRRRDGWRQVRDRKNRGERASPALTHELLLERIALLPAGGSGALDGFPKGIDEIDLTERHLPGGRIDLAVLLECRPTLCTARIADRLVCTGCGAVTGADGQACNRDVCAGSLVPRGDDRPEVVAERRGQEPIELLADHFRADGRLHVINAERAADVVYADVTRLISHVAQSAR